MDVNADFVALQVFVKLLDPNPTGEARNEGLLRSRAGSLSVR
jgi:hypothetical protein